MSSDLEDTLTAQKPRAVAISSEPDTDETVIAALGPVSVLDPHMWPPDDPSATRAATASIATVHCFRIGDSAVVLLDAIAYIGRRPRAPLVVRGGIPRLVRVQSPQNEVSSTHLELRQLGSTVVAHDLKSTNGTRVALPGLAVCTLRPGESMVVTVGTLIDIGDHNVIEVLSVQDSR